MIPLLFAKNVYAKRRERLVEGLLPDSDLVVFFNAPERIRNYDSGYPFRSDSSFLFLTGYAEPESAFLMWKEKAGKGVRTRFHMFVLARDPVKEQWNGYRYGPERAKTMVDADFCDTNEKLGTTILDWLKDKVPPGSNPRIFTNARTYTERHVEFEKIISQFVPAMRLGKFPIEAIVDISSKAYALRLIKDNDELEVMRTASKINVGAHKKVMRSIQPGMNEYEIQALVEHEYKRKGCWGVAYQSIVASGSNATVLHYNDNSRRMKDGELLLLDAGCEYGGYASDITRTIPVNGKFSKEQRLIMDIVGEAHKEAVDVCRPGTPYKKIHERAEEVLIEGLRTLKFVKGSTKSILESKAHKKYYPHGTGHWMGLDVHDPCPYFDNKAQSLKLQPGMVLTVEPGLYFMKDDTSVPKEFRGIGVRIEDDIAVTRSKPEYLTDGLPRYAAEIEKEMAKRGA